MPSAKPATRSDVGRRRRQGLALYFVGSGALLIWPLHGALGNSIDPRVLGLPWSYVYVLSIVLANFAVLVLAYRRRWIDDGNEGDD